MFSEDKEEIALALLRQLVAMGTRRKQDPIDQTYKISSTVPYTLDFKERAHVFIFCANTFSATLEDIGLVTIPACMWFEISFVQGMRILALTSTPIPILVRCTDTPPAAFKPTGLASAFIGAPNNPAVTGVGTDTQYSWGASPTPINNLFLQNNTAATLYYAFDQDTTQPASMVYSLAPGALQFTARTFTILHLQTAAAQTIGGKNGITIEAMI